MVRLEQQHGRLQRFGDAPVSLNQHDLSRTARSRLEPKRTASGEQVEAGQTFQVLAEPVEKRLAHPVWCRPQALHGRKSQPPTLPAPTDDAYTVLRHARGPLLRWLRSNDPSCHSIGSDPTLEGFPNLRQRDRFNFRCERFQIIERQLIEANHTYIVVEFAIRIGTQGKAADDVL